MASQLDIRALKDRALALLKGNLRHGYDARYRRKFAYICPSNGRYPWQWFWDSSFHAIALSHLDSALAKQELLSLVSVQEKSGFIGHVIYWHGGRIPPIWAYFQSRLAWRPHNTALIQPPVIARAAWQVFQADEDRAFLEQITPRLNLYYRWLAEHRDPDGDGLISIISPYESGMDHRPAYDSIVGIRSRRPSRVLMELKLRKLDLLHLLLSPNYNLRRIFAWDRFVVEDVMVNCVYADGLRALAELNRVACEYTQAEQWEASASKVEAAILEKCYDPGTGLYFDLSGRKERQLPTLTVTAFFPLLLKSLPRERADALVRHLLDSEKFWLPYPVPSVAYSEPSFDPNEWRRFIWRGPTWLNMNWFLARGLRMHGYDEAADTIAERSAELVLREGFREYFNPFSGKGLGARNFGWSTLVVDML
jgi:glycogen debranching enzyme